MTIFLGGPPTTDAEDKLLSDISGRVFPTQSYGQPALVKLLNNALATYNLAATARMLNLAAQLGVPAKNLFEVIGVSTGRSWMSDNLIDIQYDLLLKDVGLLRGEIGSLPAARSRRRRRTGDPPSACAVEHRCRQQVGRPRAGRGARPGLNPQRGQTGSTRLDRRRPCGAADLPGSALQEVLQAVSEKKTAPAANSSSPPKIPAAGMIMHPGVACEPAYCVSHCAAPECASQRGPASSGAGEGGEQRSRRQWERPQE